MENLLNYFRNKLPGIELGPLVESFDKSLSLQKGDTLVQPVK